MQASDGPWTRLVAKHGEALFRAAYRVLGDRGDGQDVTQEVLLEAYRGYRATGRFPDQALLRRMATLRAVDALRRRKRSEPIHGSDWAGGHADGLAVLEASEAAERLRRALGSLPGREAECFVLRYVEGMRNREIASSLNMTRSAVSTALHRARHHLRESSHLDPTGSH